MSCIEPARKIDVFVHLAHGFGARGWEKRWNDGTLIGLNDHLPYGYFWACEDGCEVRYSEDRNEGRLPKILRLGIRALLGFDFIHAWRNRDGIFGADVVWTHTESQHLAVLLLLRRRPRQSRPKVIAQSIWLFDRWQSLSAPWRCFYANLLRQADVLTVHSPENLKRVRALFPQSRSELVQYGIRTDLTVNRPRRAAHRPIHVLSIGNDRHRDWVTMIATAKGWDGCDLRIVSSRVSRKAVTETTNVTLFQPAVFAQLLQAYEWADMVVLALKPNMHASGITVVMEAALLGVPVICSDVGGLRAYFSDGEVRYVPPGDSAAIRRAVSELADDDELRSAMVQRARSRMALSGLNSRSFAMRHALLSKQLLFGAEAAASANPGALAASAP